MICYGGAPDLMAQYALLARGAGARIIGGGCGTTPEHLRAMRDALNRYREEGKPKAELVTSELGAISDGGRAQLEGRMNASTIAVGAERNARRRRRRA